MKTKTKLITKLNNYTKAIDKQLNIRCFYSIDSISRSMTNYPFRISEN